MTSVFIHTRFAALHQWPAAKGEVRYLSSLHRHEFHIEAEVPVEHDDRAIEFITLKRHIDLRLRQWYSKLDDSVPNLGLTSCEQLARRIAGMLIFEHQLAWAQVSVSEDGENGARVTELGGD